MERTDVTNRFYSPFPQFLDSTPAVRAGARLFFYAAGTSTKLDTYSDATLLTANANPLTLNSLGQPDTAIFLSDALYKIVLAPSGSDDGSRPVLRRGDQGDAVRDLQRLLINQGYADVVVDGVFGPRTDSNVRAFQRRCGLGADGIVGSDTWRALDSARSAPPADGPAQARASARKQKALV